MNNEEDLRSTDAKYISPLTVGAITGIVALLGPIAIMSYSPLSFTVPAMAYLFFYEPMRGFTNFMFDISNLIASIPFAFLRIVFVWMIYRLYRGETSLKRVAVVGIAAELQLPAIFLILYLPMALIYGGSSSLPLPVPIPLLVLVGFLLTKITPPLEGELWIEKAQTRYWWEKRDTDETKREDIEIPRIHRVRSYLRKFMQSLHKRNKGLE